MTDDAKPRPVVFILRLRADPRFGDPTKAIRRLLKIALRRCGFVCLDVRQEAE